MEIFLRPESWIALATLTFLEIVLGIDNIIFVSIVTNRLPVSQRPRARTIGLGMALAMRILLLMGISYLVHFTQPLFSVLGHHFSGRDLILMGGGIFLIYKSVMEIHEKMEGDEEDETEKKPKKQVTFGQILFQIVMLDIIFSFDSILTAVGLTDQLLLMIVAVIISILIMMRFSGGISDFISKHPTLEVLALSFLILIGFMLTIEGFEYHVPKGYIYFAVFFSMSVEFLNMRIRKRGKPVKLHQSLPDNI